MFGISFFLWGGLLSGCALDKDGMGKVTGPSAKPIPLAYLNKSLGYYFFIIQQEAANRAAQLRGWSF
jgi:simple sugar transport system substrate-binding protein